MGDLAAITILAKNLSEEMLAEINACLATSGRAAKLTDRLAEFRGKEVSASEPEPGF